MYHLKPGVKHDPVRRWSLPDRIFFGHGACAILAGVFLRDMPNARFHAERVVPSEGFAGNHVYVTDDLVAFDYHGYSRRDRLLLHHTSGWARHSIEGWACRLERVDFDLLDPQALSRNKMLRPEQYLHDPVARARTFLERIDHQKRYAQAVAQS